MQKFEVDIQKPGAPLIVHAKQGDTVRKMQVALYDGGIPYIPPGGTVAIVYYKGASGEGNYSANIRIDSNVLTIPLITQMLANAGGGAMCVVLQDADKGQLGTWNMQLVVEGVPGLDRQAATEWFTALSEYVGATLQNAERAETAASAAKQSETAAANSARAAKNTANSIVNAGYMQEVDYKGSQSGTVKDADKFGGKAPNAYAAAESVKIFTATFLLDGWQQSGNAWTQTVSCPGMRAAYDTEDPWFYKTGNTKTDAELQAGMNSICAGNVETLEGAIKATVPNKPTCDVPVYLRRVEMN